LYPTGREWVFNPAKGTWSIPTDKRVSLLRPDPENPGQYKFMKVPLSIRTRDTRAASLEPKSQVPASEPEIPAPGWQPDREAIASIVKGLGGLGISNPRNVQVTKLPPGPMPSLRGEPSAPMHVEPSADAKARLAAILAKMKSAKKEGDKSMNSNDDLINEVNQFLNEHVAGDAQPHKWRDNIFYPNLDSSPNKSLGDLQELRNSYGRLLPEIHLIMTTTFEEVEERNALNKLYDAIEGAHCELEKIVADASIYPSAKYDDLVKYYSGILTEITSTLVPYETA
jgi:hypothetical protein